MAKHKQPPAGTDLVWHTEQRKLGSLVPYDKNPRKITKARMEKLKESLRENGYHARITVDVNGLIVAGHQRREALLQLGWDPDTMVEVLVPNRALTPTEFDQINLRDNVDFGGWDAALLVGRFELAELHRLGVEISMPASAQGDAAGIAKAKLADKFGVPPFSVLDTRQGYWQDRRANWRTLIGEEGQSRENTLDKPGGHVSTINNGVSILDAVLAEAMVRWFAPQGGGSAFDPFAGDATFGYVAAHLGYQFTGIELRPEQVELNQARLDGAGLTGRYICDDAANLDAHLGDNSQDFMFTCPPYADLEVYSKDPRDLSNMPHEAFLDAYHLLLQKAASKLKEGRFAVVVIGEVRGKDGGYLGLVPATIAAMEAAGCVFYNEIVLVNSAGTLPLRAGRSMDAGRKVGKCHQNVLVFYKGNPKDIKKGGYFGPIEKPTEWEQ